MKRLEISNYKTCPLCRGSGDSDVFGTACEACDGDGLVNKSADELRAEGMELLAKYIKDFGAETILDILVEHYRKKEPRG